MLFKGSRAKIHQTSQKNKKQSKKEGGSREKAAALATICRFFLHCGVGESRNTENGFEKGACQQPWHIWQGIPLGTDHSSVVF